mgnify:CR=1 FL=1
MLSAPFYLKEIIFFILSVDIFLSYHLYDTTAEAIVTIRKYKKYNRYADRFQETYPDAKNETADAESKGEEKGE